MSAPIYLTPEEIRALTGLRQPAAQARFIRDTFKVPVCLNRQNRVIVFRGHLDPQTRSAPDSSPLPDFDALDRMP